MSLPAQSHGRCAFCGYETIRGCMGRHLAACPQRQAKVASAEQTGRPPEDLFHLRMHAVQDDVWTRPALEHDFWLDVEVRGSATLKDIDTYLRAIWLDRCGHPSQFTIGGWNGPELAKARRVGAVFQGNVELTHGFEDSETRIRVIGHREGVPLSRRPMALMARNLMPAVACFLCGKPAAQFCIECKIRKEGSGILCEQHAADHPHTSLGEPLPIVNSPRMGMCRWCTGPADPPY